LVIGSSGAGKSSFSIRLGEITGLPVIHLDRHYWTAGWVDTPKDDWPKKVKELLRGESWIIDGNYSATMDLRLEYCDTVVFLDFPRHVCTWRILKRALQYRGRSRPDIPEGCPEKMDLDFILWTWRYPERSRPNVLKRLSRVADRVTIITLKTNREVEEFLLELRTNANNEYRRLRDHHRQDSA